MIQNKELREYMEKKQAECPHDEGTRLQRYDADGCGYYIWRCLECGAEFFDDMP